MTVNVGALHRAAVSAYQDGHYDDALDRVASARAALPPNTVNVVLDELGLLSLVRGNYTDRAADEGIRLYQLLPALESSPDAWQAYYNLLKNQNVVQAALRVRREQRDLRLRRPDHRPLFAEALRAAASECAGGRRPLIVYPMIWPIAFGDTIVLHQFIRQRKRETPEAFIVLLMPLNRPDLRELAALSDAHDAVVDLTLLPDLEGDRLRTLTLEHDGLLNLSRQECIVVAFLGALRDAGLAFVVEKTRYFPVLDGQAYGAGWRIWERRAEIWLREGRELPRLVEPSRPKGRKFTLHFRDAAYGNEAHVRNVAPSAAQVIVDALAERYPGVELVRLGDAAMPRLERCRNASHEGLSLRAQIAEIQESALFLGSHSGPQHLATAVSDTPVVVTDYLTLETCTTMAASIARVAGEPIGRQVKAILYKRMWDAEGRPLIPTTHTVAARVESPSVEEVLAAVNAAVREETSIPVAILTA